MLSHEDKERAERIRHLTNPWLTRHMGMLTRAYRAVHPISKVEFFQLYSDDGRGNGNLVFSIPVADLIQLVAEKGE
jgi:hypothetical protein